MKRTKIVCTLGPASRDVRTLIQMGRAGMDVVRLNFSHGKHEEHAQLMKHVRLAGKQLRRPFAVLQDLQGPKIRVGELPEKGIKLVKGKEIIFSTAEHPEEGDIPVTLPRLHQDLKKGDKLLLDDGKMEVRVEGVKGRRITAQVVQGGVLTSSKGINIPGAKLRLPALSEKDRADAKFGVKLGVDFVALSFVRTAEDIKELRKLLDSQGADGKKIKIVVKLEKPEAIDRFDEIIRYADVVMVARGDLGIEVNAAEVPVIQKQVIEKCRAQNVPVIVATHMLESMIKNSRPTRAEVSDVANAVADHTDAVMLSGESAVGENPVQAVKIMAETIQSMEKSKFDDVEILEVLSGTKEDYELGAAIRVLIEVLGRPPIIVCDSDGDIVREISSGRPEVPIFACVEDETLARQLSLSWGVFPIVQSAKKGRVELLTQELIKQRLLRRKARILAVINEDSNVRIEVKTI